MGFRGEMHNRVAAMHSLFGTRGVANVALNEFDSSLVEEVTQVFKVSRISELVKDTNLVALIKGHPHKVGSDEAGPTGDKECPHAAPDSGGPT